MYPKNIEPELTLRWDRVKTIMRESSTEAMIVSDNTSLFYLTGQIFSGVALFLTSSDDTPIFFVRRPIGLSGDRVVYIRKVEDIPEILRDRGCLTPQSIALEGDAATYNEFHRLSHLFPNAATTSTATSIMRRARAIKSSFEIEQFKISAHLHTKLYEQIPNMFHRGMSDHDLAIEIEYQALKMGKKGTMRVFGSSMEANIGSILAGDNAAAPSPFDFALGGAGYDNIMPVGGNGTIIEEGMTVMVDGGGNFTNYVTDMTRVFSLGNIPDIAYRAHNLSLEMQDMMLNTVTIGTPTSLIYDRCLEMAKRESLDDLFMGYTQKASFVGHGVGLEINESPVLAPRSKELFERGNVVAFEPKFIIPTVGAVGIENTFVMGDDKLEKITLCDEQIIAL